MKVLVLGLGVIGTTYVYALQKAGHHVEHFIRESKRDSISSKIEVKILDGRETPKGVHKTDYYLINLAQPNSKYDFILLSLSAGKLEAAIQTLYENNIEGTLVLLSGIWETKDQIDKQMSGYSYILGYPVAGGSIDDNLIDCVLFDHIVLESNNNSNISNYSDIAAAFSSANIKIESPYDMLEWIWVHMAINAAVISTAVKYADITDMADAGKAADSFMNSAKILSETVIVIREALEIVGARGVDLNNYKKDISMFKIPPKIAGVAMKRMFAKNTLQRRIMRLHNNTYDLTYIVRSVFDSGQKLNINAPKFYYNYPIFLQNLQKLQ